MSIYLSLFGIEFYSFIFSQLSLILVICNHGQFYCERCPNLGSQLYKIFNLRVGSVEGKFEGTRGYTLKLNIFSFRVVVLVLLSREKATKVKLIQEMGLQTSIKDNTGVDFQVHWAGISFVHRGGNVGVKDYKLLL